MKLILLPLWIFRQIFVSVGIVLFWLLVPITSILFNPEEAIELTTEITVDWWKINVSWWKGE